MCRLQKRIVYRITSIESRDSYLEVNRETEDGSVNIVLRDERNSDTETFSLLSDEWNDLVRGLLVSNQ